MLGVIQLRHSKQALAVRERLVSRSRALSGASLTLRRDGFAPFESTWSLVNKIAYLNALGSSEIQALLASEKALARVDSLKWPGCLNDSTVLSPRKLAMLLEIPSHWACYAFGDAMSLPATRSADTLRFCETCAQHGFHSAAFQALPFERCPLHDVPIRETCPKCERPIPLTFVARCLNNPWTCTHCGHRFWPEIDEPKWNTLSPPAVASTFQPVRKWVLRLRQHDRSRIRLSEEHHQLPYKSRQWYWISRHRFNPLTAVEAYRLWASLEPAPKAIARCLPRMAPAELRVHSLPARLAPRPRIDETSMLRSAKPNSIDHVEARALAAAQSVRKRIRARMSSMLHEHRACEDRRLSCDFRCDASRALRMWQFYWDIQDSHCFIKPLLESHVHQLIRHLNTSAPPDCDVGNLVVRIVAVDLVESFWDVAQFCRDSSDTWRNGFECAIMNFIRFRRPVLLLTAPARGLVGTRIAYVGTSIGRSAASFYCGRPRQAPESRR